MAADPATLTIAQLLDRALASYRNKDFQETARICHQIISRDDQVFDAYHLLGLAQSSLGNFKLALAGFDRALAIRSKDADVLNNRGNVLKGLRRLNQALASYDDAIVTRQVFPEAHNNRGIVLRELRRYEDALTSYDRALASRPDYPEALNNRGVTWRLLEKPERALADFERALSLRPDYAEAMINRANALQKLNRHEEAADSCRAALRLRKDSVEAYYNLSLALLELGRIEDAIKNCDCVLALNPRHGDALNNRGYALAQLKRHDEAIGFFDRAIELMPRHAQAFNNRGISLYETKRHADALASYDRAISICPDFVEAINNRGVVLQKLGRLDEALADYDRAVALRPGYAEALNNRGYVLTKLERLEEGLASYESALSLRANYVDALYNRGMALNALRRHDEAMATYNHLLSLQPDHSDAINNLGGVLRAFGRLDEAQKCFLKTLSLNPRHTSAYRNYSDFVRFSPDHPLLRAMETLRSDGSLIDDEDRMRLDFALAKAYADCDDYERSFDRLLSGNAMKRRQLHYDEAATLSGFDRIRNVFGEQVLRDREALDIGDPSDIPVFIIGMPRSGTTLVEQILASHGQAHGAGEMRTLSQIVDGMRGPGGETFPECFTGLAKKAITDAGAKYADELSKSAPSALRIVDKQPSNFYFAGLIHLALPNAKIVHVMRNPLDTCVSCFSLLFNKQNYTYDLAELGRYYACYRTLMDHWTRVLPQGRILNVRYEEVVQDFDNTSRRIVEFCGLEWDERCLSFHRTDRVVTTASAIQVRQPLYESSIGRWRAYREFLGPLIDAIGPLADDDGRQPSGVALKVE